MSTRTVQLDDESAQALDEVMEATGLTASEVLKRGVWTLRHQLLYRSGSKPYEVYKQLDLGPGGHSRAPSSEVRRGLRDAIVKKLGH